MSVLLRHFRHTATPVRRFQIPPCVYNRSSWTRIRHLAILQARNVHQNHTIRTIYSFSFKDSLQVLPAGEPATEFPLSPRYCIPNKTALLNILINLNLHKVSTYQLGICEQYLYCYSFPTRSSSHINIGNSLTIAIDDINDGSLHLVDGPVNPFHRGIMNRRLYCFDVVSKIGHCELAHGRILALVVGLMVFIEGDKHVFTHWVVALDSNGILWAFHSDGVDERECDRWVIDEWDRDDDVPPEYPELPVTDYRKVLDLFGPYDSPLVRLGPLRTVVGKKGGLQPEIASGVTSWTCFWVPSEPEPEEKAGKKSYDMSPAELGAEDLVELDGLSVDPSRE
ncbi:hypothetical protein ONS95_013749 [Cadophora gregata]|uniref:uncharacterized protein n=1 Tax=Cadophora gregata TaxID=51156 RepID=UPI0026DB6F70|nr:uncharacterized protein ONS95_013749 [Cadophora gregata]KAK0113492.1 hypothetical protein ONS96_014356 [Cadophora gregata f. sp. sojae]KAK0114251.1 hypothetical protein ONS95_013749 [Cadophora gregata]